MCSFKVFLKSPWPFEIVLIGILNVLVVTFLIREQVIAPIDTRLFLKSKGIIRKLG